MRSIVHVAVAVVLLGVASPTFASAVDERSRAIFHDFMSPYCPGLLLADCSSRAAATLRTEIREELAAGTPEAEVRTSLERRFGERILAAPPRRGFGLVAWLAPYVAVGLACAAVVAWCRRRLRLRPPALERPAAPVDPDLRARFEDELRRY